jgi:hypothetical protein
MERKYRFKTISEAEDYFWEKIAKHNDDQEGLELWLEQMNGDIREVATNDI